MDGCSLGNSTLKVGVELRVAQFSNAAHLIILDVNGVCYADLITVDGQSQRFDCALSDAEIFAQAFPEASSDPSSACIEIEGGISCPVSTDAPTIEGPTVDVCALAD